MKQSARNFNISTPKVPKIKNFHKEIKPEIKSRRQLVKSPSQIFWNKLKENVEDGKLNLIKEQDISQVEQQLAMLDMVDNQNATNKK